MCFASKGFRYRKRLSQMSETQKLIITNYSKQKGICGKGNMHENCFVRKR